MSVKDNKIAIFEGKNIRKIWFNEEWYFSVLDIIEASKGTSFESHFANPDVKLYLTDLLNQHFNTSIFVERSWHADVHSHTDQALEFRAKYHSLNIIKEA